MNNITPPQPLPPDELDDAGHLDHLLALDLTSMLDESERVELDALLASDPAAPALERAYAETAARFTLASAPPSTSLDPALRTRLLASAAAYLDSTPPAANPSAPLPIRGPSTPAPQAPRSSPFRLLFSAAGYALAACLALILLLQNNAPSDLSTPRASLITQDGISPLSWKTTDPANPATGDVVWSPARQSGVMRFTNFKPNNPAQSQYQLWIFDANRPESTPVDGGVFNIPPPATPPAEVLVPITPTLRVSQATLFAITEETPGGVVVSDRKRLHLIAPVPAPPVPTPAPR